MRCLLCVVLCKKESSDIRNAKNLADLKGAKIAAQAATFHADALSQIEDVQSSTYPEFSDLLAALKSGAIGGYVAEEPTALAVCGSDDTLTYIPPEEQRYRIHGYPRRCRNCSRLEKGSDLRERMNSILAEITDDQKKQLMEQIVAISSGKTVDQFAISSETPAEPVGTLKIGMECAYEPYNWTDMEGKTFDCIPISGEGKENLWANGYDVQIAKYIADRLNLRLETQLSGIRLSPLSIPVRLMQL